MKDEKMISERAITKNFMYELNNKCEVCNCVVCNCKHSDNADDINYQNNERQISRDELYSHFDNDNNNVVSKEEYVDHIEFHKTNDPREDFTREDQRSPEYEKCFDYSMNSEVAREIEPIIQSIMNDTDTSCYTSCCKALFDVLTQDLIVR
jgi:hypothetical protein